MIRHRFAKPALIVLAVLVLVGIYDNAQRNRAAAYPLTPAFNQRFDSSAQNVDAPQPESPEAAYGSMPQSDAEDGEQQGAQPAAYRSYDSQDSTTQIGQYRQQSTSGSNGSAPPPSAVWTQVVSPDGSAILALPGNWRIAGGAKGMVATEGPSGEQVVLGLQTFVTPNQAPYMGPEQALAWFMRSHGMQLVGIQQHEAQQARSGQVELMVGESELQGRKYKFVARVTTSQIGMGNWMLQISSMGAPVEQFDAEYRIMQKIWNSWNLDPRYVQNALQAAANTREQTAAMLANGAMARFNGWKPIHEEIDQDLRGVSTVENSTLGKRYETPLGTEQQYLNNCTRNGQNCRQVPTSELVPQY